MKSDILGNPNKGPQDPRGAGHSLRCKTADKAAIFNDYERAVKARKEIYTLDLQLRFSQINKNSLRCLFLSFGYDDIYWSTFTLLNRGSF